MSTDPKLGRGANRLPILLIARYAELMNMPENENIKPHLKNGIKGHGNKVKPLDLEKKTVLKGISNGNVLQQGSHLIDSIFLLNKLQNAGCITLQESSALKIYSIASNLLLNNPSLDLDKQYAAAITQAWSQLSLLEIWQVVAKNRAEFIKLKGSKNLAELRKEAEANHDYILGLVIRAEETRAMWESKNPELTDDFKTQHNVKIIYWLELLQVEAVQAKIKDLISMYAKVNEPEAEVFTKQINSSIGKVADRNKRKLSEDSLAHTLYALYAIEECGVLYHSGKQVNEQGKPLYNYLTYVNGLNPAMFHILRKYVWQQENENSPMPENLIFRQINFKELQADHPIYAEFWANPDGWSVTAPKQLTQVGNVSPKKSAMSSSQKKPGKLALKSLVLLDEETSDDEKTDSFCLDFLTLAVKEIEIYLGGIIRIIQKDYIPNFIMCFVELIENKINDLDKISALIDEKVANYTSAVDKLGVDSAYAIYSIDFMVDKFKNEVLGDTRIANKEQIKQLTHTITLFGETYRQRVNKKAREEAENIQQADFCLPPFCKVM